MRAGFRANGIVTLTTDFGGADGYVGAMKGVMLSLVRGLRLVDIAHDVPPQDLRRAAACLAAAAPSFPEGTVHLAVVDPGVGTSRKAIVIRAQGQLYVGPDNGIFSEMIRAGAEAREIDLKGPIGPYLPENIASTFHGRDIFAPTAAILASGLLAFDDVGPVCAPMLLSAPEPEITHGKVVGHVAYADRFGNCVTNIGADDLSQSPRVRLADGTELPWAEAYADVPEGSALALLGSEGWLEIAVNGGSAARSLGLSPGAVVEVSL